MLPCLWLRTQLMAGARLVRGVASRLGGGRCLLPRSAATKTQAASLKDDSCTTFLHWLQRKAGTQISSALDVLLRPLEGRYLHWSPYKRGTAYWKYLMVFFISSLADFQRCVTDFLNHDGRSNSILLYNEQKDVSEVIADRNYAVGEQIMIRYGKYSNAVLALNFGFTLTRNIYDQAQTWVDMPDQDSFSREKLATWLRHHHCRKSEDMFSCNYTKASFVVKEVKFCGGKGMGVPQILRAFFWVFYATSLEELEEMSTEAARGDGRLARRPLENIDQETHAHRMLLLHLDEEIQGYFTAIEHLEIARDPACTSVHPFRKEMAKDILVGELCVLRSARAWVATYCETLNNS